MSLKGKVYDIDLRNLNLGAMGMTTWLRVGIVLAGDLNFMPRIYIAAVIPAPGLQHLFLVSENTALMFTYLHRNTHAHI